MTISVTQLNNYIRGLFDTDGVLNDVSVCGEVTNLKKAGNGWYFSLKDDSGAINCFSYFGTVEPSCGLMVVCEGQVNFFAKSGSVSLFVRRISATKNLGSAYLRFAELKEKLQKEGLFDDSRKRIVPSCCATIGVVTSETGAVIHDITNVALRRQPFTNILLYPVKVQGEGADDEIARGVKFFSESDVDVVIVGRGGGSNEDLSSFNAECVVRAVADCSKPVVSAVGHGIDYTLCDFVADRRAVTPSEAAEFVTLNCVAAKKHIADILNSQLLSLQDKLSSSQYRLLADIKMAQAILASKIDMISNSVKYDLGRINTAAQLCVSNTNSRLQNVIDRLHSANPTNILRRGYAYVVNESGAMVNSANQVEAGMHISLTVSDGSFSAVVATKERK